MEFREFWLPKRGNRRDEWEDAWSANTLRGRFAVADGAADSAYAGSWARCVVEHFVKQGTGPPESWVDAVPAVQAEWMAQFQDRQLPWYAEAKLQHGAFATFLGLATTLIATTPAPRRARKRSPSGTVACSKLAAEEGFEAWIEGMRDRQQIRNDDVTLVAVWW
jgi:hypothetical protein